MASGPDYYKALGRRRKASRGDQEGLPQAGAPVPPDRNPGNKDAEERFKEISEAHDVLGDRRSASSTTPAPVPSRGGGPGGGFRRLQGFDFDASHGRHPLQHVRRAPAAGGGARGVGAPTRPTRRRPGGAGLDLLRPGDHGAQVPLSVPMHERLPDLPRHGRQARHDAEGLPRLRGPRRGDRARACSRSPSLLALRRLGHGHRGPLPDLSRRGRGAHRQAPARQHPRRGKDGSRIRLAGKGEPGHNGGPAGDLYLITHVSPRRCSRAGRQPRGRGAAHDPRGAARRRGQGADARWLEDAARRPGTKHGTVQRLRGEGPPRLGGEGRGDIHYRFVIDVPEHAERGAGAAVDELAKVMNGDPARGCSRRRRRRGWRAQAATTDAVEMDRPDRSRRVHDLGGGRARDMHPQTLRMYEARGLIEPKRSPKGTRLYSQEDVERLRRIQEMTAELGLNLAGVERVLALEAEVEGCARASRSSSRRRARRRGGLAKRSERCAAPSAPSWCPIAARRHGDSCAPPSAYARRSHHDSGTTARGGYPNAA